MTEIWAAVVGFFLDKVWGEFLRWRERHQAKKEARLEDLEDEKRRLEEGREAVAKGRDSGKSPDERLRDNDGRWL